MPTIVSSFPYTLQNGTTADATQVMADFLQIQNDVNTRAAENGANSTITSLSGLTTPLSIAQGGTGAATAGAALTALGAAALASPTFTGVPAAPTAAPGTNTTQLATTAFVAAGLAALLVSPTFTGTPAAPTAAVDTNTTQLATTAFVLAQAATAGEMEAGASTSKYVTPSVIKRSAFVPKAFAQVTISVGVASFLASAGMTSVTRNSTGITTIVMSTPMSSVNYAVVPNSDSSFVATGYTIIDASTFQIYTRSTSDASGFALTDEPYSVIVMGDQ